MRMRKLFIAVARSLVPRLDPGPRNETSSARYPWYRSSKGLIIMANNASTSSVAASSDGGYDQDFVEEVPARFICQICAKPYRDPHLTVCCGQYYCQSCLQQWFAKNGGVKQCPHCRATRAAGDFDHVLHKGLRSEINELKVHCSNKKMGCPWTGELAALREHLERVEGPGCEYSDPIDVLVGGQ